MSNYLEEIEAEYSRIRGKWSPLSPIDWNLADTWQKKEIPLNIVLRAMSETWSKFEAKANKGIINTLRYFEPEVEAGFTAYNTAQVGKAAPIAVETFLCLSCKHYETDSEDFYKGCCANGDLWQDTNNPHIFDARVICNPESEGELPEYYQYYEPIKI